jgi:hypothetical protein
MSGSKEFDPERVTGYCKCPFHHSINSFTIYSNGVGKLPIQAFHHPSAAPELIEHPFLPRYHGTGVDHKAGIRGDLYTGPSLKFCFNDPERVTECSPRSQT